MTYAVNNSCEGHDGCEEACRDVCPVNCIFLMANKRAVIDPESCIDCDACREECPLSAIKDEEHASASDLKFNATQSARLR